MNSSADDLAANLLHHGKKGSGNYRKQIEQIEFQIRILRNKNNMIQKQSDNDIDGDIKKEIYEQSKFVEDEIHKIKASLSSFTQKFRDPTAKNKAKELWRDAGKEIERNKIIMERLLKDAPRQSFLGRNSSVMKSSILTGSQTSPGKQRDFNYRGSHNSRQQRREDEADQDSNYFKPKQVTEEDYDGENSEFLIDQQIQRQRGELLTHLEEKNLRVQRVMNEIALIVNEQGENIEVMADHIDGALENTENANYQLQEAQKNQRKAKKKYCKIAIVVIVAVLIIVGVALLLI